MSLKVSQLQQSSGIGARMEAVIRETLNMIDTRVREADRAFGRNVVDIELETAFAIPGLAKQDQQRYVYSKVISSLGERGFEARITLGETKTMLLVAYTIDFSKKELDAMNKVIKNARLNTPEEVTQFCQGGDEATA